jgi:hypothetical protein
MTLDGRHSCVWWNNTLRAHRNLRLHNNRLYPDHLSSQNDIQSLCSTARAVLREVPRITTTTPAVPEDLVAFAEAFAGLSAALTQAATTYEATRRLEALCSGAVATDPIDHLTNPGF